MIQWYRNYNDRCLLLKKWASQSIGANAPQFFSSTETPSGPQVVDGWRPVPNTIAAGKWCTDHARRTLEKDMRASFRVLLQRRDGKLGKSLSSWESQNWRENHIYSVKWWVEKAEKIRYILLSLRGENASHIGTHEPCYKWRLMDPRLSH